MYIHKLVAKIDYQLRFFTWTAIVYFFQSKQYKCDETVVYIVNHE